MKNREEREDRDKLIQYMATHSIYPIMSPRGKIYLRCSNKEFLDEEKRREIINKLNIRSKAECTKIREEIKRLISSEKKNRSIKEWVKEERPREMLVEYGAEALPSAKLLAIILRTGKEGASAEELSRRILNKFRTLRNIDSAHISEICKIEGIGIAKAAQIKAAFELGKRLIKEKAEKKVKIKRPEDIIDYVLDYYGPYLRDKKKEFFYVVLLDTKNHPIHNIEISKGGINSSIVEPKEIVKEAALRSATALILVHNHPSGDVSPSKEDMSLTQRIIKACNIMDIRVLDHIIIGKNRNDYFSFNASGFI